ncbi:MAG: AraC family transcriptional regulator [Nostoc sp.]
MLLAVQQILQCPYQGITKRIYFESKVWELTALMVEQELQINQGNLITTALKPSEIERICYAKEILLQHIHNPPSLMQLARQVGLNDRKLKQGFKQIFGTTVFGYLHNHRMELAQKLLIEKNMNVTEVARTVGYASLPSFSYAFYKKFGVNPKSYQTKKVRLE